MRTFALIGSVVLLCSLCSTTLQAEREISLDLRTRDRKTNELVIQPTKLDPHKVGIIIIDPWNYHWCMTACQRVSAMAPRWNRVLECARKLGMQVIWAPTEAASQYAGTPQREWAAAVELVPVPHRRNLSCVFTTGVGPCMCGPGITCECNYGLDGICRDLVIDPADLIVCGTQETYSIQDAAQFDVNGSHGHLPTPARRTARIVHRLSRITAWCP
jgi:hypothetical protein